MFSGQKGSSFPVTELRRSVAVRAASPKVSAGSPSMLKNTKKKLQARRSPLTYVRLCKKKQRGGAPFGKELSEKNKL